MAYATQSDLVPLRLTQKELVELTNDTRTGEVDPLVVDAALEEASGRVDSYCRNRYVTPLQPSGTLTGLTLDITVYLLFSRRRNVKLAETVRQRFEDAMQLLKDIAAGKANLDQPGTVQTPQSSTAGPVKSPKPLRFGERDIEGFC